MTFVGHSLMGASLAQAAVPANASWKQWLLIVNIYVLLAFFPDLPLPGWGHSRYFFSHSLFVNLILIIPLACMTCYYRSRKGVVTYPLVAGAIVAWLSHFPLDALYNHGQGVAIYWPFSDAVLNLPLPWFDTLDMRQPLTAAHNVNVFWVEALVYLPLFGTALFGRYAWLRQRKPAGAA
jgi:inner membrane protein